MVGVGGCIGISWRWDLALQRLRHRERARYDTACGFASLPDHLE